MSSYIKKVKHPITGKKQDALFLDDYYGEHQYGVGFRKDGEDTTFDDKFEDLEFFKIAKEIMKKN